MRFNIFNKSISGSNVGTPFATRVENFWKWFDKHVSKITGLLAKNDEDSIAKVVEMMDEGVSLLGENVLYNIGVGELTFCVESDTEDFYIYPYLVEQMPENLKIDWEVYPCKQPENCKSLSIDMYGQSIPMAKVKVAESFDSDTEKFKLAYYHPALAEMTEEESESAFYAILDMWLGEGAVYNYIGHVEAAESDNGMHAIGLLAANMRDVLDQHDIEYSTMPLLPYCQYKIKPEEKDDGLRSDVLFGTTQYMDLINEYYAGERDIYCRLASKGVWAAMLIITQPENMDTEVFIKLRHRIEDVLIECFDKGIIQGRLLGGAYGTEGNAYIDILVYDTDQFAKFIGDSRNLDKLLAMKDGKVCPSDVYVHSFVNNSKPPIPIREV